MLQKTIIPVLLASIPTHAYAAPEEVQVYMDEIDRPREVGLDIHINTVVQGEAGVDYVGAESSLHRWRITPEFSYGLGHGFEAGLYFPLATVASDNTVRVEGAKVRLKWIAPHSADRGFYWGGNFEIGRVAYRLDQNPWNAEFKAIAGWRNRRITMAVNGNIDFVVSGRVPSPATLELASKFGYRVAQGLTLGVESYNGLGPFKSLGQLGMSEQSTFFVVDSSIGGWDVNAGIGKGYGANSDHLTVKLVIGVPLH